MILHMFKQMIFTASCAALASMEALFIFLIFFRINSIKPFRFKKLMGVIIPIILSIISITIAQRLVNLIEWNITKILVYILHILAILFGLIYGSKK